MKTNSWSIKKTSLLLLGFFVLLIPSVSLTNIVEVEGSVVDASGYARGLLTPTQWSHLLAASFVGVEDQIWKYKDPLQNFPTDADSDYYIVISSGDASSIAGGATTFSSHYTWGPTSNYLPPPYSDRSVSSIDIARLSLTLVVPWDAAIVSFDWKFATEEMPDPDQWYVPPYWPRQDWAMATVTTSAGTENILLLPDGKPVDVLSAYQFFNRVTGSQENPLPPYPWYNDVDFNAVAPHWGGAVYTAWFDVRPYVGDTIQIDFWVADEGFDGYRDSALFIDNLRFGPPVGNLIAQGISAIQTVPDVDLVQDKPATFNISYVSTFPNSIETDIRVDLTGFDIPYFGTFRTELNPGAHHFYLDNVISYADLWTLLPTGKTISYQVKLDAPDAIPETNEFDNYGIGPSHEAHDIHPADGFFDMLYVRLHHEYEPSHERITEYHARRYMHEQELFLFGTYPLRWIYSDLSPNPLLVERDWDMQDILDKLADRRGPYNRVVGVASDVWDPWYGSDLFDGNVGYANPMGWKSVAVLEQPWILPEFKASGVVAHEIGHTYGLGEDYAGGWVAAGSEVCKTGSGYWVIRSEEMIDLPTFMHSGGPDRWVDDVDYNILLWKFNARWGRDPEVLRLSGRVFRDGTAELSERLCRASEDDVDILAGSVGNYYIALLDDLGNTLSRVGFNITFHVLYDPPREVDEEYFSFTMEWAGGTRLIQLEDVDGNVLAARDVSPNPPSVTVNSPNGGEVLTPGTDYTITWSAMDPDGDTLTYNVLISNGVDSKPVPIATGLDQTSFTYNFTNLPGGNQCLIHVEATDGVNVGSDVSDDFFTVSFFTLGVVTQPQSVSEGGNITYALNITSYGGFSDPVTLSAESPTAPNLIFRWDSGATVAPLPSGSIIVSMEVEVPAGTEEGYHTIIVSGVVDNNPQVAITSLFVLSHDIAVINVAPSETTVDPEDIVSIDVTVQNQGSFNEIFLITVYYDTNTIKEQWVYLHAGETQTLTFMWNTTGVASGSYAISAYATPIPDETDIRAPPCETDTADNTFIGDTVIVGPLDGFVIPEVLLGTIIVSAAIIIALVAYIVVSRWRRKQTYATP